MVRLSDLGTTVLSRARVGGTLGEGRDLLPLLSGAAIDPVPVFMEATRPIFTEGPGWNNARSERGVVSGEHFFTRSDILRHEQLYRLDRAQTELDEPQTSDALGLLLDAWDAEAPEFRGDTRDAGVMEALRALGYVE